MTQIVDKVNEMEDAEKVVMKFMKTLFEGRISEAEKMLEKMQKRASSPQDRRVYQALYGIYYAYTTDDMDSLIFKIYSDGDVKKNAGEYLKALETVSEDPLGGRDAYIETWKMILKMIDRLPMPHKLKNGKIRDEE